MKKFGLAVIGCGMGAKPHAGALKELADVIDVKGIYARSEGTRTTFASEHGFAVAESAERLAADPSVDAALILTPPNAREDLVRLFATNGKHVLCEKPLERSEEAARRIVGICESNGVNLGVVLQHRFRQASEKLAGLLASGALGEIRAVRVDVPWWRDQKYYDEPGRGTYARDGGGVLISQAIHTLDLMLSLTGPVAAVQALAVTTSFHEMEAEDFVAGGLQFESGAVGSLFATTAAFPGEAESIRLDCDKGSVLLKSGTLTIDWRSGERSAFGETTTTGGGADPMAFPHEWHRDLIADFVKSAQSGQKPRVTGRDALQVHALIAALEKSSAERAYVSLNHS